MPGEKESFRLIERFMGRLVFSLNKIHGTNYSSKYWKIIIRPWLRLFLENAVFYSKERDSFNDEKCDTKINVPLDFDAFFDDYFLTEEWRDSLKSMINKSNNVDEALHNDENYNLSVIYKNINDTNYSTGYKKRIESGFCFMSRHIRGGFSTDIINLSLISKIWIKCRLMPRVLRHIPTNLKNTSIIKKKKTSSLQKWETSL